MTTGVRVKAHKVCAGMTVTVTGETGEWTVLSRHPKGGHWWLHRWVETPVYSAVAKVWYTEEKWETSHAHYSQMMQVIGEVVAQ